MWLELLLLAVASAFWPLLLAVDVVALHAPHPVRLLACFLAGGPGTCVLIVTLVAKALKQTSLVTGSRPAADPVVYLGAGVLAFLLALLLARRQHTARKKKKDAGASLYERALQRGAPLAFVAGVVLNIVPGV